MDATNSAGKNYLLQQIFGDFISIVLFGRSDSAKGGLVSSDGYMLTDKNEIILIAKE